MFDVDGTLTPAKSKIDPKFAKDFFNWQKGKQVYIVSGGSFLRLLNQLGRKIVDGMQGIIAALLLTDLFASG